MKEKDIDDGKDKKTVELRNADANLQSIFDEDFKKSMSQTDDKYTENEDPTKHTLLNDALVRSVDDNRVKHFTEYKDYDDVLQMNEILDHANLLPLVFGHRNGLTPEQHKVRIAHIQQISNIFFDHSQHHMNNMMSFKEHTKLGLVHALRNDTSVSTTDKEIKKMFGGR